jgi:hypothetical protein
MLSWRAKPGERSDDFEERKPAGATSVVEPPALDDDALIDAPRHRRARSLSAHERKEIDAMVEEWPAVDVEDFDFNCAAISSKVMPPLDKVGDTLMQPELKDAFRSINGHADAKGSEIYHRGYRRRAEAVTVGRGRRNLKNPVDPFGPENRRVSS